MNKDIKVWKTYYVTNDCVLSLLKMFREADGKEKDNIKKSLSNKLVFLVYSKIKGYKKRDYYDDLFQECRIGLLKAIEDFDPFRGSNFFKFACWHIQHKIRLFNRYEKRYKKITSIKPEEECFLDIENDYEKKEFVKVLNTAFKNLTEIDKEVLKMRFINNYTFRKIGEKFSLSKQRIEQIEKQALRKLKNNKELVKFFGE